MTDGITVVPANDASWEDLQSIVASHPTLRRLVMRIDFADGATA